MARHSGLSFYKQKKKISKVLIREIFSFIFIILIAIFLAGAVDYFFGMYTNIVGVSMEPTLNNGQRVFINRFAYTLSAPKKGDVIVFLPNGNRNTHYYVKRIVARQGDTVVIENGICYVNGEPSSYIDTKILQPGIAENELKLGVGEYFCVGDNPNNSEDSRSANIGLIKEEHIIGKVWLRLKSGNIGFGLVQ